jgi:hypothetical protein
MSFFFEAAGSVTCPEGGGQLLLIVRWGDYGILADGTPVQILRLQEWPESPYGEWIRFTRQSPPQEDLARDFLIAMEAAMLLDEKSLDMESVWSACQAFANATSVHTAFLNHHFNCD